MGKHHHKPHEGHSDGTHVSRPADAPAKKHSLFFYVAGLFILLGLIAFILSGNLAFFPRTASPAQSTGK